MTVHLQLLPAVALAGIAYLGAEAVLHLSPVLRKYYVPEPILGGLAVAAGFLLMRAAGIRVEHPTSGYPVDFLIGLLTANMGLHVTPGVLRKGWRVFFLFLGAGLVLFFVQLLLAAPVWWVSGGSLRMAILTGPLALVGAPFNLNPPSQTDPVAGLFPTPPDLEGYAQGVMMVGVLAAAVVPGILGRHLLKRAGEEPPSPSPADRKTSLPVWTFAIRETALLVLILTVVSAAFALQGLLLGAVPGLEDGELPVVVLCYLLGAAFRMGFETAVPARFPDQVLTVLLLGPTMGIVLTYAVMSVPLHHLGLLSAPAILSAVLAAAGSLGVAWLLSPVLARVTDRYYASVVSVVFLAVTTGWGPMGMSYLHQFTDEEGPVKPMPVILPLNAFYIFPWMVILLTTWLLRLAE